MNSKLVLATFFLLAHVLCARPCIYAEEVKSKAASCQKKSLARQANEMKHIQDRAYRLLETHLASGTEEDAVKVALDYLRKEPFVREAGVSEGKIGRGMPGIWIVYKNGMSGGVTYRKPGYK